MMRSSIDASSGFFAFRALVWLTLLGIAVQFFLAGLTVFGGGAGWETHAATGGALAMPILVVFAMTLRGPLSGFRGFTSLLLAGYLLQVTLAALGDRLPMLGALHPVNGLAMGLVAFVLVARIREARP